jgi:dephospho-CoA kinase
MNEYEMLLRNDFYVIRIVADEEIRIKRLLERDGKCDINLLYNESESGCAHLKLIEIYNNGTKDELYKVVDGLIGENDD